MGATTENKIIPEKQTLDENKCLRNKKNRIILLEFLSNEYTLKIDEVLDDGDIRFHIYLENPNIINKYMKNLLTTWFTNMSGEIIVRENIDLFTKRLLKIENYSEKVNKFEHKNFGLNIDTQKREFCYQFHSSLIQRILTEDIKLKIE